MTLDPNRHDPARNDMLAMVKEGMGVVDSSGDTVGKVSFVHMADVNDPDDSPGSLDNDVGLLDILDPDTDSDVTERMRQRGYIRIDASGIFTGDKYVLADDVAAVEGDTVRLGVLKDDIKHPG